MEKLYNIRRYSKETIKKLTKSKEENTANWNFATHIYKEEQTVSWNITNVSQCFLKIGQYYQSPHFCTGYSNEVKWTLRLYPKGRKHAHKVGIFIYKVSETSRTEIKYLLQLKLIPESTKSSSKTIETFSCKSSPKCLLHRIGDNEMEELREWGVDDLIPSRYLLDKKSLWILCHFNVAYVEGDESLVAGLSPSSTLYADFKEMYKSGKYSDVTLRTGNKSFPAHKAILAARSVVFAAMFNHDMKEAKTNEITIEDVDPSAMKCILQYIYTGRVKNLTFEKAATLFPIADMYSLGDLRKSCVSVMLSNLSLENVCEIAVLADMHTDSKLKTATNYFFRNYKYEIFQKKEWREIVRSRPQLASDILETVSSNFNTTC